MQVTYEGQTKEELQGQIEYCKEALSNELEPWEQKEFEAVLRMNEAGLKSIEERTQLLKQHYGKQ